MVVGLIQYAETITKTQIFCLINKRLLFFPLDKTINAILSYSGLSIYFVQ